MSALALTGLSPQQAAARLAKRFGIPPAQAERLAIMLEFPEGLRTPAGAHRLNQVHICKLRQALDGVAEIGGVATPNARGKPRITCYRLTEQGRDDLMALAATLPDGAPDPRTIGPHGLGLTATESILHHCLVATGDGWLTPAAFLAELEAVQGKAGGAHSVSVHICRLRAKVAGLLPIETFYGHGWRYQPAALAAFLNADLADASAPAPFAPKKEEGPAR